MLSRKRPSKLCLPGVKMSWPGSMRIILGLLFLVRSTIIPRVKGRIKWEIVKIYDAGYLW